MFHDFNYAIVLKGKIRNCVEKFNHAIVYKCLNTQLCRRVEITLRQKQNKKKRSKRGILKDKVCKDGTIWKIIYLYKGLSQRTECNKYNIRITTRKIQFFLFTIIVLDLNTDPGDMNVLGSYRKACTLTETYVSGSLKRLYTNFKTSQ